MNLTDLKEKYTLTTEEFEIIKQKIISNFTKFAIESTEPTTIILGAQPGAGKSELEKIAFLNLDRNAIVCNVDNLKNFHPYSQEISRDYPEYFTELTNEYAHKWNLALRNYCLENKLNFILETTFADGHSINLILEKLKSFNFKTELYLLSVPKEISLCGITIRYEENLKDFGLGRKVSYDAHNDRYDRIPEAIKIVEQNKKYDFINLYGRNINQDNDSINGVYLITRTRNEIYSDFINERSKPLSHKADDYIKINIEQIKKLMNKRNASMKEKLDFNSLIKNNFRKKNIKISKGKKI